MAKPLTFLLGDLEYPLHINKVDRSRLYGTKEVEAVDDQDVACELATLADDGRTIIGRGGTGLGWLDADGRWRNKSELTPVNVDGDEIKPVKSSFGTSIRLFDTASLEDYLDHNIRLVYTLELADSDGSESVASNMDELIQELQRGTIFKFPYSYRGGLEADTAFMLLNEDGEVMMVVGNATEVSWVGIQTLATVEEDQAEDEEEEQLMDFGMI